MSALFEKKHRIRERQVFERLYRTGSRIQDDYFRIYYSKRELAGPQLGIAVTKRVGNAVVRNRLKRWIREWFRTHYNSLPNLQFIVQVKPAATHLEFHSAVESLNRLIGRANAR